MGKSASWLTRYFGARRREEDYDDSLIDADLFSSASLAAGYDLGTRLARTSCSLCAGLTLNDGFACHGLGETGMS